MSHDLPSQRVSPQREGEIEHERIVPKPEHPKDSGYAEPTHYQNATAPNRPNPDAAGNERAQVAGGLPGEEEEDPGEVEETPPGENKREPIHDPDPADTKLHVQQSSR